MENNTAEITRIDPSSIIASLNWRSAIKKFDPEKKLSESDLETLIEAANLAPSSGGLQPFQLIVVSDPELKAKLQPVSYGQPQVVDCSHLFIFAAKTAIDMQLVEDYVQRMAEVRNVDPAALGGVKQSMGGFIGAMSDDQKIGWAARQAYISLGFVISAAAAMRIDTCPMEGFSPQQYVEILGLEEKGLMPFALLTVGYRGEGDPFADLPKVRKKKSDFVLQY